MQLIWTQHPPGPPQIHHWRTHNLASLIPRLAPPSTQWTGNETGGAYWEAEWYCLHNRKIQSWPQWILITITINIVSRGVNPCGGYNNSKWGFSDWNYSLLLMLFRCEVVNYHTGIVVPFSRDWSLAIDCYCTTTTWWIHTCTKTTSKRRFPGAYESRVTAYGTKKATSLHSGRSVMTHDYVARPVQEVMHSFCSCSCSDVVTTLFINCCWYWTYHEMTTTRLIPPGLLSLYRLHTWPLNRA